MAKVIITNASDINSREPVYSFFGRGVNGGLYKRKRDAKRGATRRGHVVVTKHEELYADSPTAPNEDCDN